MTDTHDTDSSESEHAVQSARAGETRTAQAPAGETDRPAHAEGAEGEERPRRGLRRGPRSLIARRRAGAKNKGAEGSPDSDAAQEMSADQAQATSEEMSESAMESAQASTSDTFDDGELGDDETPGEATRPN